MSEPSREEIDAVAKAIWDAECIAVVDDDMQGWQQMVAKAAIDALDALRAAKPERQRVIGRLCDSNYVAGLTLGWNLGLTEDRERFDAAVNSRALKGDPASTVAHLPNVVVTKQEW